MDLTTWWAELNGIEQIYWLLAIPSTILFLIILITTFIGGGIEDMASADAEIGSDDGIGFQFFTLKNLIGFFMIFSWVGIACLDSGFGQGLTLILSFCSGLIMMSLMAALFYFISKLTDSGTLELKNAIGCIGEVYLPIEHERSSFGKVQIMVQGSLRTLQALTDDSEDLKVGQVVKVLNVINEHVLLVTKESNQK